MPDVLEIERLSFANPCTEDDFYGVLRQRNCIGMVAQDGYVGPVLGFMIYELNKGELHLLNLAVHPEHRSVGIGSAMINRLKDKLSQQRRKYLVTAVPEELLGAQLFFKACGFRACCVLDDAYEMVYTVPGEVREERWRPRNRISEYVA